MTREERLRASGLAAQDVLRLFKHHRRLAEAYEAMSGPERIELAQRVEAAVAARLTAAKLPGES